MKPGSLFENIVALIQSALIDQSDQVQIHQNIRLKDNAGNKREIDILLTFEVNGHPISIAIECKDHKNKIKVGEIDAFKAKCDSIASINKMVLVTRTGFQAAAKNNAQQYGIDLFLLSEVTDASIKSWFNFQVLPMTVARKLKNVALEFRSNERNFEPDDILLLKKENIQLTLKSLVQQISETMLPKKRIRETIVGRQLPETEEQSIRVTLDDAELINEGPNSGVASILVKVQNHYTRQAGQHRKDQFISQSHETEPTSTYSIHSADNNVFSIVDQGDGTLKLMMRLNPQEAKIEGREIIQIGTIIRK